MDCHNPDVLPVADLAVVRLQFGRHLGQFCLVDEVQVFAPEIKFRYGIKTHHPKYLTDTVFPEAPNDYIHNRRRLGNFNEHDGLPTAKQPILLPDGLQLIILVVDSLDELGTKVVLEIIDLNDFPTGHADEVDEGIALVSYVRGEEAYPEDWQLA